MKNLKKEIRLKCCPFCGCDQMTIYDDWRNDLSCVCCDQCGARGPAVDESDLMDGFIEAAPEEEIKAALHALASDRWNCRPPMSDCYPEDLETLEDDLKLKGGALYGSSVYKD